MEVLCERTMYIFVQIHHTQADSGTKSFWGQRERKSGEENCAALQLTTRYLMWSHEQNIGCTALQSPLVILRRWILNPCVFTAPQVHTVRSSCHPHSRSFMEVWSQNNPRLIPPRDSDCHFLSNVDSFSLKIRLKTKNVHDSKKPA